jgi:hypothetical protein
MCRHTAVYVPSYYCICVLIGSGARFSYYIYVHILLYVPVVYATIYVLSYCCICALILLYMCPHRFGRSRFKRRKTTSYYKCVSSYCCICHYICVLMLLYMCAHRFGGSVQAQEDNKRKHAAYTPPTNWNPFAPVSMYTCHQSYYICVSSYIVHRYTCIRVMKATIYVCPHTTMYVSSYYYLCVLILLYMCPHTTMYVSSYYFTFPHTTLYMCPHTTMYVS